MPDGRFGFGDRPSRQEEAPRRQLYARRRTDRLDYIQAMLGQLRTMAEAERCDMLAYFIEMAYTEASDIIRGDRPSNLRGQQRDASA